MNNRVAKTIRKAATASMGGRALYRQMKKDYMNLTVIDKENIRKGKYEA